MCCFPAFPPGYFATCRKSDQPRVTEVLLSPRSHWHLLFPLTTPSAPRKSLRPPGPPSPSPAHSSQTWANQAFQWLSAHSPLSVLLQGLRTSHSLAGQSQFWHLEAPSLARSSAPLLIPVLREPIGQRAGCSPGELSIVSSGLGLDEFQPWASGSV